MNQRPLPQDTELEADWLSGILNSPKEVASDMIRSMHPGVFYDPQHRSLFEMLHEMATEAEFDAASAIAEARQRGHHILRGVMQRVPNATRTQIGDWTYRLKKMAHRRSQIHLGWTITEQAYDTSDPGAVDRYISDRLADHATHYLPPRRRTWQDITDSWRTYRDRIRSGDIKAIKYGVERIDRHGPIHPEYATVIARTKVGKTPFALNGAVNQMLAGEKLAFYSGELTEEELCTRLVSLIASVSFSQVLGYAPVNPVEAEAIQEADKMLDYLPLSVKAEACDGPELCRWMLTEHAEGRADVIWLDQFDKIKRREITSGTKEQAMGEISGQIFDTQRRMQVPVYLLHQLKIKNEHDRAHRPHLGQVRDCSQLIQDVHRVYLLDRPEADSLRMEQIAKQRDKMLSKGNFEEAEALNVEGQMCVFLEVDRNGTARGPWNEWIKYDSNTGKIGR